MRRRIKLFILLIYRFNVYRITKKKIRKIYHSLKKQGYVSPTTKKNKIAHYKLWSLFPQYKNISWLAVYQSISGVESPNYIPENIYYSEVEPRLNYKPASKCFSDKNFYHKNLDNKLLPEVYLRNIDGVHYSGGYEYISAADVQLYLKKIPSQKYVIKPTDDTGGGDRVRLVELVDDCFVSTPAIVGINSLSDLLSIYGSNFIVQEYLNQHGFYEQFNHSSLNTVRVLTYRSVVNEEIVILHSVLRMGAKGSVVDNQASGGIACGIDTNGRLLPFGVTKRGTKHFEHNGVVFSKIGQVYKLNDIHQLAVSVAKNFLYSRLLGLDFCVDNQDNVKLIEVNNVNNEINFYQMTNGPLFGNYTQEIIEYCKIKRRSFLMDFTI